MPEARPEVATPEALANGRLDSWKEIAAYLKHDVRTVQRWEETEGLPVYRHPGKQRGTVHAYKPELDAWQKRAGSRLERPARRGWLFVGRRHWLAALAASVAVLAGLGLYRVVRRDIRIDTGQPTQSQIAAFRMASGLVSPDGNWLAYRDAETAHLWIRDLQSGRSRILAPQWTDWSLAWSRDSRRLAFVTLGDSPHRLETIDVRTGAVTVVAKGAPPASVPRPHGWSPDGTRLLATVNLSDRPAEVQMAWISLKDEKLTPVSTVPGPRQGPPSAPPTTPDPQLSPDGRLVAYTSRGDIHLIPADGGGQPIRLTEHRDREWNPVWSPDGRSVLFVRRRSNENSSLWAVAINPQTGAPKGEAFFVAPLGHQTSALRPSVSPRGDLFLSRDRGTAQVFLLEVDPKSGLPRGSPKSGFPAGSGAGGWSPDGSKLYYRNWAVGGAVGGDPNAFVERDIKTGQDRLFQIPAAPPALRSGYLLNFRPGRPWILHADFRGHAVYRYDTRTQQPETLLRTDEELQGGISLSPDEMRLAFATVAEGRQTYTLRLFRLSDRTVMTLASSRLAPQAEWSPDSRTLAYTDANCLMVVPAGGGTPKELVCATPSKLPQPGTFPGTLVNFLWWNAINPTWSPDGRRIAWTVNVPENNRVELWIVDYATGKRQVAWAGETDYYTVPRGPLWSPDGTRIAFSLNTYPKDQIWVLRNLPLSGPPR